MAERSSNIVLIGAHPDDCEINAGGTCAKWVEAGYRVCLVSMTNGDIGHYQMAGGVLAQRRAAEAKRSAEICGVDCIILDHHDGELQPTLEARKKVVHIIRDYEADLAKFEASLKEADITEEPGGG